MDWLLILGILAFGGLIIGWMGYTTITDSLIKDQKREIRKLENENRRLKQDNINLKAFIRDAASVKEFNIPKQVFGTLAEPEIKIIRHNKSDMFGEW